MKPLVTFHPIRTKWLAGIQQGALLVMLVAIVIGGVLIYVQENHIKNLSREGQQAHAGLCVLKADLKFRIEQGTSFVDAHPRGVPGIPIAVINQSIAGEQSTLLALEVITCPK